MVYLPEGVRTSMNQLLLSFESVDSEESCFQKPQWILTVFLRSSRQTNEIQNPIRRVKIHWPTFCGDDIEYHF